MDIQLNLIFPPKKINDVNKDACSLLERGIQFMSELESCDSKPDNASKEEYCVGSTLHRGYYNPSPVYDIIVGNTSRGRISKKPSADKVTHRYFFDRENELFKVDNIYQSKTAYTEWLYRENNVRYGFTVDCGMHLSAVTKESYQEGRLVTFALVHCIYKNNKYEFYKYHEETYQYDIEGLHLCNFISLANHSSYLVNKVYAFKRENGFLVSYSECRNKMPRNAPCYSVKKKRKA